VTAFNKVINGHNWLHLLPSPLLAVTKLSFKYHVPLGFFFEDLLSRNCYENFEIVPNMFGGAPSPSKTHTKTESVFTLAQIGQVVFVFIVSLHKIEFQENVDKEKYKQTSNGK
jgi:hypothetical protein